MRLDARGLTALPPPKPKAKAPKAAKPPKPSKPRLPVDHRLSPNYVKGVGSVPCPWMLVGEGPGKNEDRGHVNRDGVFVREPFIGAAGQLQDSILEENNLQRGQFYITNVVKRRVENDEDPTPEEIALFRPDLLKELQEVQPRIVIAAGGFATRFFLGSSATLDLVHGLPHYSAEFNLPIVPVGHPASILHESDNAQPVYWDYAQAAQFLRGEIGIHEVEKRTTRILPLPKHLLGAHPCLGIDTEFKADHEPICATVAFGDGLASYVAADDHEGLRQIALWSRNPDITIFIHNAMADLEEMRKMGVDLGRCFLWDTHKAGGFARAVDTMVLLFNQGKIHAQGLKVAAYRILHTKMQSYEDIVGPRQQALAFDYLLSIPVEEWPDPEPIPVVNEKLDKLTWSRPWGMGKRITRILGDFYQDTEGVDLVARWGNIEPETRADVEERYGAMPTADLTHCDQTEARHYACQDADMTRLLGIDRLREHERRNLMPVALIDHGRIPLVEEMQTSGMPANREHFVALGAEMRVMQREIAEILSLLIGREINPNSSDQVAQLLYHEMGLDPVKFTGKGKPSTGKKALQHLRESNMLVDWIMQSREFGKIDDAFCDNIYNRIRDVPLDAEAFEPRAFYQLMVTRVKTGRLAAKNFNVLAIPVRTELGKRVRKGFIAHPGHLLATWDLSQIEVCTMAHQSQDARMVEILNRPLSLPKWERDIHILTAVNIFGVKAQDVTKMQRQATKSTNFGAGMGVTGRGLRDQMRLYGLDPADWPEDRCDEFLGEWFKLYPGVKDYQFRKRGEARRQGGVRDLFGRWYPLPQVHCPLAWIREEALRQSHALDIQGTAQELIERAMARVYAEGLEIIRSVGHCQPLVQIHDELLFEIEEQAIPVADAVITACLCETTKLSVPVRASGAWAQNWGDIDK